MRFMLIVTAVAVAMLFDLRDSRAYQGPWCAVKISAMQWSTIAACEPSKCARRK
jgi:hypothetical protein